MFDTTGLPEAMALLMGSTLNKLRLIFAIFSG
jgi:hypothetical protein